MPPDQCSPFVQLAEVFCTNLASSPSGVQSAPLRRLGFWIGQFAGGSTHKKTIDGELHRKPILFRLGADYAPAFIAANRRAAAARGRHSGERRAFLTPSTSQRASTVNFRASPLNSPKATGVPESPVPMGEIRNESGIPPQASEPKPRLEAALDRLLQVIRQSRGG
jgi:hypothetical protein